MKIFGTPIRMIRSRRAGRAFVVGFLALVALIAFVHAIELLSARKAWKEYRAKAEARGVQFSLAELLPDSNVPEAENFATVPIIAAGVRARRGVNPFPTDLDLPSRAVESLVDSGDKPADLARLRAALVTAGWTADDSAASDAVIVLRGLAHLDPPLGQLRDGTHRSYARYTRNLEHPENTTVPPFLLLRKAAQALYLRFEAHAAAGELDAACDDFELSLGLARTLDESPVLVGGMIKVSLTYLPVRNLRHWLHRAPWSDAHLARFSTALGHSDLLAAYARGMATERAFVTHYGTEAAAGRLDTYDLMFMQQVSVPTGMEALKEKAARVASRLLYPRGWHLHGVVWANERIFDWTDARVDAAQHRWNPTGPDTFDTHFQAGPFEKFRLGLAYIAVPNTFRAEARTIATQAQVDLARTALALEQHRRAHGAYPAQLADLAPATLAALPHDLTDGAPLRYRLTANGRFQLYALSFNRTDDGGSTEIDPATPDIGAFAQTLDWVWPQPTEPAIAAVLN